MQMPAPPPRPYLVLLVDDDLRTAKRMADMLREDGFAVEVARDGAAAIACLARSPIPDAIVTELNIPHADGTAVAQFARTRRADMRVVVVTGYPHLFRPAAFGAEPPLVFTKPVEYMSLRDALASPGLNPAVKPVRTADLADPNEDLQLESARTDDEPGNTLSGAQAVRALQ